MSLANETAAPPVDRLLLGWSGGSRVLLAAIRFCRLAKGSLLVRERDVIVVEIPTTPEQLASLLHQIPKSGLTHLSGIDLPGQKRRAITAPWTRSKQSA